MSLIDVETYLTSDRHATIDVRSPGEFAHGHIPGAVNVPLFDDEQRAEVGTLYKQSGRDAAMVRGLQIVGEKADRFLDGVRKAKVQKDCFVHCWRGGMRSEGFAWFLKGCEMQPRRIDGGYKAYRRAARVGFAAPQKIVILAGSTGAGKTRLLGALHEHGEQVIDLEGLANHRGSAFGGIGQPLQPTVEQFENDLFMQWRALDPNRPVWIECESRSIGKAFLPAEVWAQMSVAPAVNVEVPRAERVAFLIEEYGALPNEEHEVAIRKIAKRLGGDRLQAALAALEQNDLTSFTDIALEYYDKAYDRSQAKHPRTRMATIQLQRSGQEDSVNELCKAASDLFD
ncbi:MAG: tRNA 2-selenouridine(34) synthase MnmH [Rubripirellula sp.]